MELAIALFILIALSELREWRFARKHRQLVSLLKGMRRQLETLTQRAEVHTVELDSVRSNQQKLIEAQELMRDFVNSTEDKLSKVLREYELNGIPLGYQRKNLETADYVEGL